MKWAIYALLIISHAMCGFSQIAPWTACAIGSTTVLIGAAYNRLKANTRKPKRFAPALKWGTLTTALALLIALEIHTGRGELDSWLLRFIIDLIFMLIGYRAFEHDTRPQRMQVVFLSLLPFAAMAYTLDATIYLACLLAYAATFMACMAIEAFSVPQSGATAKVARNNALNTKLRQRDFDIPGFTRQFITTLAAIFITSFATFFLIPRLDANPATIGTAARAQSGAFPDIDLDKTGDIDLQTTLLFTADLPVTSGSVYWRIDVQDRFDGKKWSSASFSERIDKKLETATWHHLEFTQNWRDWHLPTVTLTNQVKLPDETQSDKIRIYTNDAALWYRWGWKGVKMTGFDFTLAQDTLVDSFANKQKTHQPHRRPHWPNLRPLIELARCQTPTFRPARQYQPQTYAPVQPSQIWPENETTPYYSEILKQAKTITESSKTNLDKADAVVDFLQNHYTYSLKRPVREAPVVADFLFTNPAGHCEVFSSTMAVLLNKVGVPTRNVSGFMSDEFHDGKNYVRSAHAHSWVEVYDEQTNTWVRFDPTPPSESFSDTIPPWVRFNDWFLTYRSSDLYHWIPKHLAAFFAIIASLIAGIASLCGTRALYADQTTRTYALAATVAIICLLVAIVFGPLTALPAIGTALLAAAVITYQFAQRDPKTLWHHAIQTFRTHASQANHELANQSLENIWKSSKDKYTATYAFFDAAIKALYADSQENSNTSDQFAQNWNIRKLLHNALRELKK